MTKITIEISAEDAEEVLNLLTRLESLLIDLEEIVEQIKTMQDVPQDNQIGGDRYT